MKEKYKQIEFSPGENIDSAVKTLIRHKENGRLVCGTFNGTVLYSDVDDVDSAYEKIMGMTKSEYDKEEQQQQEEYKEQERKHKNAIPKLTKEWIEKGSNILDEKYHELWQKAVPIRLDDLYHGMELGCCLDIVEPLNNGCDFEIAKDIIEKQGHSGMSHGLVCSMVRSFCDRGEEFVKHIK